MAKLETIGIRVDPSIKRAIKALADARMTSESEIAREAMLAYLHARGITVELLRETPPPDKTGDKPSSYPPSRDTASIVNEVAADALSALRARKNALLKTALPAPPTPRRKARPRGK